jgi:molybdopterin-guanine dinucleotide biosynthesis protein A
MTIDALVIAGGYTDDKMKKYSTVAQEALIPIGNRVMVEYVIDALEQTEQIDDILVVGPVEQLQKVFFNRPRVLIASEGETAIDSVLNGITVLKSKGRVLILTADIPLINAEVISKFLLECQEAEVDLFYPIVPKRINEEMYPQVKRTYVSFDEGKFTGGNMFLVNPDVIANSAQTGKQLVKLRKSPLALSSLIGWAFVLKLLTKQLGLKEVEDRFSQLLGLKGKAVIFPYPEVGIDVDKPSDLALVKDILAATDKNP